MRIGFTGTRNGMTPEQLQTLRVAIGRVTCGSLEQVALHGDCIGADAQFHEVCKGCGFTIYIYPGDLLNQRAFCTGAAHTFDMHDPLTRNKLIVNNSDVMFAAPKGYREEVRSGTWATIRYTRKSGKHLIIIWPDGTITEENED